MAHSKSEIRKAKNLLNKYAPKGEQLAFINAKEVNLLKRKGGSGKMTKAGIRSYTEDEEDTGDVSNAGSSSSSSGGGGGDNDNNFNASAARFTPTQPKSILSRIGSGIVNYIKKGGLIGMGLSALSKGRKPTTSYNPLNDQGATGYKFDDGSNNGGNDQPPAMNVGGKIIKLSPTSAEVSQSKATDVTYDSRKTKARGRSMTILTSAKGIGRNMGSVLGSKSLLGA